MSYEEADEILQGMLGFSASRSKSTIERYDTDANGKIDYEEFLRLYTMIEEE